MGAESLPAAGQGGPSRSAAKSRHAIAKPAPEQTRATRTRRRRGRALSWALLVAGLLLVGASAWVGWRTYQAYTHLQAASADVAQVQDQLHDITAADPDATMATVSAMQAEAAAAVTATSDPVYRLASALPIVGPNLDAIREVTVTVDSLATNVMPSVVDIARTLQPSALAPKDGVIALAPIERISPLLQSADEAITSARQQLGGIDQAAVAQPVGDAVRSLIGKLDNAADVIEPGARTARLLPPMLGAAGPRTYLVVFQNPAELRATGGIFGSFAVVSADQGKITITDQGAASRTLGVFDPAVTDLGSNEKALYSDMMAQYPQDVNFTPDYPTAAALFAEMYRTRTNNTVDGVLAIDPVALSYTLQGRPGIDVGQGFTMTSDNLVSTLLSTAYQRFDDADQAQRDQFLDDATSKVFSEVMSGTGDPRPILNGLRKAADERRVLIYSADPAEQADIEQTGLAGVLSSDPSNPTLGVFMNDRTAAKLGYYLHNEVHVTEGECRADGRRELQVRVAMKFDAPTEGLPSYVSGTTEPDEPYVLKTNLLAFAPVGGAVAAAQVGGEQVSARTRRGPWPRGRCGAGRDDARHVRRSGVHRARAGRRDRQSGRRAAGAGADPRGESVGDVGGCLPALRGRREQLSGGNRAVARDSRRAGADQPPHTLMTDCEVWSRCVNAASACASASHGRATALVDAARRSSASHHAHSRFSQASSRGVGPRGRW